MSAPKGSDLSSAQTKWSAEPKVMTDARAMSQETPSGTFLVRLNHSAMIRLATAITANGPIHAGSPAPSAPRPGSCCTATAGPEQQATIHTV